MCLTLIRLFEKSDVLKIKWKSFPVYNADLCKTLVLLTCCCCKIGVIVLSSGHFVRKQWQRASARIDTTQRNITKSPSTWSQMHGDMIYQICVVRRGADNHYSECYVNFLNRKQNAEIVLTAKSTGKWI